jgi:hypothetical protein
MKTKEEIVQNWLPRYTGEKLENFGKYILLTNFSNYVNLFASWHGVEVVGRDRPMQCATAGDITIINFGMGSPTAATVMDLLSAIEPEAVLFLGKCGGLKKPSAERVLPTIISPQKYRHCPRLRFKKRFPPPYVITRSITGPAPCTPPTGAFGNTMNTLRNTCKR